MPEPARIPPTVRYRRERETVRDLLDVTGRMRKLPLIGETHWTSLWLVDALFVGALWIVLAPMFDVWLTPAWLWVTAPVALALLVVHAALLVVRPWVQVVARVVGNWADDRREWLMTPGRSHVTNEEAARFPSTRITTVIPFGEAQPAARRMAVAYLVVEAGAIVAYGVLIHFVADLPALLLFVVLLAFLVAVSVPAGLITRRHTRAYHAVIRRVVADEVGGTVFPDGRVGIVTVDTARTLEV